MKPTHAFLALCLTLLLSLTSCYNYYYIVRHAEKGQLANPDTATPLSAAGMQRAAVLDDTLQNKNVTVIYVSEFLRTQQTAAPSAAAFGITPTMYSTSDGVESLVSQLRAISNRNVLVVGHSDTVPNLVLLLTGENVGTIDDFDNLFVVKRYRCSNPDRYVLFKRTYGTPSP